MTVSELMSRGGVAVDVSASCGIVKADAGCHPAVEDVIVSYP